MAKSSPSFQFYPEAWLVGTAGMSKVQKGAYIDLLCYAWTKGGVIPRLEFRKLSGLSKGLDFQVVSGKFILCDSGYTNSKLDSVRANLEKFTTKQRENALVGVAKRQPKASQTAAEPQPEASQKPGLYTIDSNLYTLDSGLESLKTDVSSKKKKHAKKNPSPFFPILKTVFLKKIASNGSAYYFSGKDGFALKQIENKIAALLREEDFGGGEVPTPQNFGEFFEHLLHEIKDPYMVKNFTLPVINSQWNAIINKIKIQHNGQEQKLKNSFSEIDRKAAEYFGS